MHRFGPEGRLELAEEAGTAFDPESVTESEALRLTVGPCHLDRDGRRDVQRWLQALGHDPRGIDGMFGPGSRAAIAA